MNLGAVLVLGVLALKFMEKQDATTYTTPATSPPRPTCGIGEVAIYKADLNKWFCVPKGFG